MRAVASRSAHKVAALPLAEPDITYVAAQEEPEAALTRYSILKNRPDFLKAARAPRAATGGFILQARKRAPGEASSMRVGFTCSKKVGNAVARNRAKRRLREIARLVLPKAGNADYDYVLIGRAKETAARDFTLLQDELHKALDKLHS